MSEKKKNVSEKVSTFSLESLRKYSRKLFGVSQSTFDGATSKLDKNINYKKDDIKDIISKWLGKVCE